MILDFLWNRSNKKFNKDSKSKQLPKDTYMKIVSFFKDKMNENDNVIIVCIGTNRTNLVDSLGPFVGSLLKEDKEFNIAVYGSLVNPINALNLTKKITEIKNEHPHSIIIAVDAALGDEEDIGNITVRHETLHPGAGNGDNCGEFGDFSIIGVVAPKGIDVVEYDTDLNFISAMAYTIAKGLKEAFK